MSNINDQDAEHWIKSNHPDNGLFRVYWKDIISFYDGSATLDPNEGEGLRYEWYYKDGKKNGVSMGWWPNGKLKHKWYWKNDIQDGKFYFWYESGQKKAESIYKDGEKDEKWTWWYENGQKEREVTYKYGEYQYLLWIEWDHNGVEKKKLRGKIE